MALRIGIALAWPAALTALIYERVARLGFNLADDGLMASYTHRILLGQVPHEDFISPRPVGSAIAHLPDLILPLPLYLAARLVGTGEVVLFSVLLGALLFDAAPWRWNVAQSLGVAASVLVNLHTFNLSSWYTFDGLLLVSAGLVLIRAGIGRPGAWAERAGLLALGLAVVMKQSFFAAPVMGVAWLAWESRDLARPALLARVAGWTGLVVAPMALYVLVITVLGGFDEMVVQMLTGRPVWGSALLEVAGLHSGPETGRPPFEGRVPWEVGVAAMAVFGLRARRGRAVEALRLGACVAFAALVMRTALGEDLAWQGVWSLELMWALILTLLARAVLERTIDWFGVTAALLGWMSMLSWGYDLPALMGGTMALLMVVRALEAAPPLPVRLHPGLAVAVLTAIVLVVVSATFFDARSREPYFDRSEPFLTETVEGISGEFGAIRTAPATADFLRGFRDCLERFPARRVAVIPDGPGLYPAFDLESPFPIDWFFPQDYVGSRDRLVASVDDVAREGDYLVLFQTESAFFLVTRDRLPAATRASVPVVLREGVIYDPGLGSAIIAGLPGRRVVCGSFLGIYRP